MVKCIKCKKDLELCDPTLVELHFRGAEKATNRNFFVCEKCALGMIQEFVESDPIIQKCDADESRVRLAYLLINNSLYGISGGKRCQEALALNAASALEQYRELRKRDGKKNT